MVGVAADGWSAPLGCFPAVSGFGSSSSLSARANTSEDRRLNMFLYGVVAVDDQHERERPLAERVSDAAVAREVLRVETPVPSPGLHLEPLIPLEERRGIDRLGLDGDACGELGTSSSPRPGRNAAPAATAMTTMAAVTLSAAPRSAAGPGLSALPDSAMRPRSLRHFPAPDRAGSATASRFGPSIMSPPLRPPCSRSRDGSRPTSYSIPTSATV